MENQECRRQRRRRRWRGLHAVPYAPQHVMSSRLSFSLSINVVSEASLNFVTESGEFQNSGRVHYLSELTADYDINSFSVAPLSL